MKKFEEYLKKTRMEGRQYFTSQQALTDLHTTPEALKQGIYKLKKKGDILRPAKGLYIIIPPEHQKRGCLPAADLVPILMQYKKADYYAGLLTAALYHGASHQKPQTCQIITNRRLKPLILGKVKIDFIYKKALQKLETKKIAVSTGYLVLSSPEVTAMDLLLYPNHSGGLNHIATILSELVEKISPDKLAELIFISNETAWVQRLGYILETINWQEQHPLSIINKLKNYILERRPVYIPLASELSIKGAKRNKDWMIIENTEIEIDE